MNGAKRWTSRALTPFPQCCPTDQRVDTSPTTWIGTATFNDGQWIWTYGKSHEYGQKRKLNLWTKKQLQNRPFCNSMDHFADNKSSLLQMAFFLIRFFSDSKYIYLKTSYVCIEVGMWCFLYQKLLNLKRHLKKFNSWTEDSNFSMIYT